ncbi:hypothetical protein CG471_07950 [Sphingobium sp. IP1]|uniref:hypothetical protein n=1 Tax=Sphingobium sp. IP1 TaxID=2021637 RepID=UPI000C07CFF9|nr:hypothetical protein [Sphingobium sp. IP1]PHP20323.1 hypothetical protein CG471_07950 [Sphingobium sp. IP1]
MTTKKTEAEDTAKKAAYIAPADKVDTSGAPQQIVPDVDLDHPAVDNDPRAGTTVEQNQIDFNDPTLTGQEAVEKSLAEQAK